MGDGYFTQDHVSAGKAFMRCLLFWLILSLCDARVSPIGSARSGSALVVCLIFSLGGARVCLVRSARPV